jgi:anti-sigma factor RsiW
MSRFPRLRRRQDRWADEHAHARTRLAERLDGPLGLTESTWLDEHLAGCPSCAATAAAFEDDRLALRALRDQAPEPPRDLWARTSAALDRELARGQRWAGFLDDLCRFVPRCRSRRDQRTRRYGDEGMGEQPATV